jgi:hypothetical protein
MRATTEEASLGKSARRRDPRRTSGEFGKLVLVLRGDHQIEPVHDLDASSQRAGDLDRDDARRSTQIVGERRRFQLRLVQRHAFAARQEGVRCASVAPARSFRRSRGMRRTAPEDARRAQLLAAS